MDGRFMVFEECGRPLALRRRAAPVPAEDEILVRVAACAVCRTDLHLIDGELEDPALPVVPGHQAVGFVDELGNQAARQGFQYGDRVGIPWLGGTCGCCGYCAGGRENLCDGATFTGCHRDGGYADFCVARAPYCFPLPENLGESAAHISPLLCAGLIGYRTLRLAGDAETVGLYGFGSAARLVAQVALFQERKTFAFTRPGDTKGQEAARRLGVHWAGGSDEAPPSPMDAALIFAPAGQLVPAALKNIRKGGSVVCGGIHMSDIPSFPYRLLWGERTVRSVANLTRRDGTDFLDLAARARIKTEIVEFPLEQANEALEAFRSGELDGTAVLVM